MTLHLQLGMTWNCFQVFLPDFPKDIQRLRATLQKLWSVQIFASGCARRPGWLRPTNVLHVGNMKTIYICLSNARSMPKPGRQMFSNVPHGVLVYSPETKYIVIGPKNKRVYRYYPPEMFCACTFDPVFENGSAFANKWQPLRTAASAFWPASHEWKAVVPGCYQISQEPEIFARLYCSTFFRNIFTVYTDCMNVLDGFNRLVGCHVSP